MLRSKLASTASTAAAPASAFGPAALVAATAWLPQPHKARPISADSSWRRVAAGALARDRLTA
jgi:hypothetical protein